MRAFSCKHLGITGSTNLFVERVQSEENGEEIWEARVGIAIMGYTNNLNRVNNPFDSNYHDNYARGFGTTEQKAIEALKREMEGISKSLF